MLDILILNGTIIDGTGRMRYKGNIGVEKGIIKSINDESREAVQVINADGLIVCPGFIDNHSHSDYSVLDKNVNYANCLQQGITTEITGMCGGTPYPFVKGRQLCSAFPGIHDENKVDELAKNLKNFSSYIRFLEKKSLGTNMAFYVGHSSIRTAVMGSVVRKPDIEEIGEMKKHIRESMESGALGLSSGLIYPPGAYAETDELVDLCKVVAEYGGSYISHIRSEGNRLLESIEEAINIGRKTGVPVNISHIKVVGQNNWGKASKVMELIDKANAEGLNVTADMYPYKAGATYLISALPPKFASGGYPALLISLKDKEFRLKIKEAIFEQSDTFENLILYCGFDRIIVLDTSNRTLVGKTIEDIANETDNDSFDVFCDLLVDSMGTCFCGFFMRDTKDIDILFKHPMVMAGSDGGSESLRVPVLHPRHTGTFPKMLKDLVIDKQLVTLEEAVRKFCKLPADTQRLNGKGLLKEGYDADILIIDYERVNYTADYINPKGRNTGFKYVLVNGKIAVKDDQYTGTNNGKLILANNILHNY
jgi:N-acyl-D-amino-acid deacylase